MQERPLAWRRPARRRRHQGIPHAVGGTVGIIDASVILRALYPDESQSHAQALVGEHTAGQVCLAAPDLQWCGLTHAVVLAVRRGRITNEEGIAILGTIENLGIARAPVT